MGRSRREDDTAPLSSVRTARRAARERRIIHSAPPPSALTQDDYTDDELSPGDATDLTSAIVSLKESLALIFSDVKSDDFRNPNLGIRKKFEEWRMNYGDEYRNAFGGLALVGVWEFWARVEMALWNPFEVSRYILDDPCMRILTFLVPALNFHRFLNFPKHQQDSMLILGILL